MSVSQNKKDLTYPLNSDGSPKMIEYRNAVNRGEVKKMGRPFLTAAERAESLRRRKEYMETYRAKRKRRKRSYADYYDYEEAREKIQNEGIRSASEYHAWHNMNHPARMPSNADHFYSRRGVWISWNHFLGTNNEYPYVKKLKTRSYKDAKAYAHGKGFKNVPEWTAFCKSGKCPEDIPHRPDIYYFKTGDWFSWREFLGPRCKMELGKAIETVNDKMLYILNVPDPSNSKLYRIGLTVGGWPAIRDSVKKYKLRHVASFTIDTEFNWKHFVSKHGEPHWESDGVFEIANISAMTFELSQLFIQYRPTD